MADQGLALAGAHFGDLAVVQGHAADQLHIEVAHARAPACRPSRTTAKASGSRCVERLALGHALLEFVGLGPQLLIGERLQAGLERIDALDGLGVLLDQPVVAAAENLLE